MLKNLLQKLNLSFEDVEIKDKYGDISFNIKKLSKKYGINPEILEKEIEKILKNNELVKSFEKIGDFYNIYLNWQVLLPKILKEFGFEIKIANKILVEHTSANPNKALHIGHLRNACLGDSIARFLRLLGNKVFVANYIDDTGAQMAELLIAFKYLNRPIETNEKFDIYCGKIYSEVNKLLEKDENLKKLKSIIVKELEEENSFTFELNKKIVEKVLKSQLETIWYFDIYYDFINKESDIIRFGLWNETFNKLKELKKIEYIDENKEIVEKLDDYSSSIIKRKAGTYVIPSKSTKLVLIRSDGTLTYLAKDIAYAFWKHSLISKRFLFSKFLTQPNGKDLYQTDYNGKEMDDFENFDLSINVIGREQAENQYVIQNLINEISNKKYIYYSYGLVLLSKNAAKELGIESEKDVVKMSGRKGLIVNIDDLVKKFEEKVMKVLKERNVEDVSLVKKIVKSCLRYEMLKLDKDKDLIFDFNEALRIDGNTAIYLMYTYARINSIIKNLANLNVSKFNCKLNEFENQLAREIIKFESVINSVAKTLEINQIANYAYKLCKTFNIFYENCRIIDEKDEEKRKLRVILLLLTKKVLEFCFDVLGIDKVDKI
ncbi:MAG: arginine--tRNA ligase [Candidatus Aenigmatarchaeota archaeon]